MIRLYKGSTTPVPVLFRRLAPLLSGNRIPVAPIFSLNLMPEDSGSFPAVAWSSREIGFVSQKRRGRLTALRLCRLPKAYTWSATVLVDMRKAQP
jgi:hypothetical protein